MKVELPELPARGYQNADGWCDDAMRAYGIACAQAALDAAAKVCDERVTNETGMNREDYENRQCARAIRAIQVQP